MMDGPRDTSRDGQRDCMTQSGAESSHVSGHEPGRDNGRDASHRQGETRRHGANLQHGGEPGEEAAGRRALAGKLPATQAEEMPVELDRMLEALLFASAEPVSEDELRARLPFAEDLDNALARLQSHYRLRGVQLLRRDERWAMRTAPDLAPLLAHCRSESRPLSRAARETLAIIAWRQPVTRAEIEEIRGVSASKGTLDVLLQAGWIDMTGRQDGPGRPVVYGTTPAFLDHFNLTSIEDLPGIDELQAAGLMDRPGRYDDPGMAEFDFDTAPDTLPDVADLAPDRDDG